MFEKIDWNRAAYGGIIYVIGIFVVVSILYICLSYGISFLSDQNAILCASRGIACSQQRTNTLNVILQYWYAVPIFAGVLSLVYLMKYGLESDEGGNAY
jgi:hypothetical protein